MHKKVDILVIALSKPLLIGVYENGKLIEEMVSNEQSSDVLPLLFEELFSKYQLQALFYVNGPGSFMAIKVAYIFLRSLSIVKKIPLYARDAFYFNNNAPIKAVGKLYFVKMQKNIQTQKLETAPKSDFVLPDVLEYKAFGNDTAPLYRIGAV